VLAFDVVSQKEIHATLLARSATRQRATAPVITPKSSVKPQRKISS